MQQINDLIRGIPFKTHQQVWWEALRATLHPDTYLNAAGLAYFAFISLFPLLILVVAAASQWFDPQWIEGELVDQIDFVVPGIRELMGANILRVIRGRRTVTGFAAIVLLWSGSTFFSMLTSALDRMWGHSENRAIWKNRGLSLIFVVALSLIIFPLILSTTSLMTLINQVMPDMIRNSYAVINIFVGILARTLLIGVVIRYLPNARPTWWIILPGALTTGILWEIARNIFLNYISQYITSSNLVYGSLTAIVAFFFWMFITGLIFLFGALVTARYDQIIYKSLA